MLNLALDKKPPSVMQRADIMSRHIEKGGIPIDYDRLIEYYTHFKIEQEEVGNKLLGYLNSNSSIFKKSCFTDWVRDNGLIKGFNLTETGNISYNEESLKSFIQTNAYGDAVNEVIKTYLMYSHFANQTLLLPSIINAYPPTRLESADGRRLILVKPKIVTQNTGRFGMVEPALMNLPRYMKDLYVAPKGWTLMSADSSQIEPKIIYGFFIHDKQILRLISLYGDAYFAVLHYCTMPVEDIKNKRMDFILNEITPEMRELRQRLKTYGNGVMYGSTSNKENDPLKSKYIDRIGHHPLRVKWQAEAEKEVLSGKRVFHTLFGTPIDISLSEKVIRCKDDKLRFLSLVHCAINNRIQGTAGDCMGFSLQASDELFERRAPNSWITKFVHDEGQYCIHNSEVDYVMDELKGHTAYNLGNIVEVTNDPIIGRKWNTKVPTSYKHLFEV